MFVVIAVFYTVLVLLIGTWICTSTSTMLWVLTLHSSNVCWPTYPTFQLPLLDLTFQRSNVFGPHVPTVQLCWAQRSNCPTFLAYVGIGAVGPKKVGKLVPKKRKVGKVESRAGSKYWTVGKLLCWNVGKVESQAQKTSKVGKLAHKKWKVFVGSPPSPK